MHSFLAALDRGSLLGAARVLNSIQPKVGWHIAELKSQLGVVLIERTGRGLKPLAMALKLAESARAMETNAHQLQHSVSSSDDPVRITESQPLPACCCRR